MRDCLWRARLIQQSSLAEPCEAKLEFVAGLSRDAVVAAKLSHGFAAQNSMNELGPKVHRSALFPRHGTLLPRLRKFHPCARFGIHLCARFAPDERRRTRFRFNLVTANCAKRDRRTQGNRVRARARGTSTWTTRPTQVISGTRRARRDLRTPRSSRDERGERGGAGACPVRDEISHGGERVQAMRERDRAIARLARQTSINFETRSTGDRPRTTRACAPTRSPTAASRAACGCSRSSRTALGTERSGMSTFAPPTSAGSCQRGSIQRWKPFQLPADHGST